MGPIYPPSAIPNFADGSAFLVGGRVVYASDRHWILADAYAQVTLDLNDEHFGAAVAPGDLLIVQLDHRAGRLRLLQLVERSIFPEPSGDTEFGRQTLGGRALRLRARSAAKAAVHLYFQERGFVEVDTPSAVPCPGLDAHVSSWGGLRHRESEVFLITSPEFHMKRLLAAGLPKIYQMCHCFRSEEHGPWHEPEFMMLEWYRAFSDWDATMRDSEALIRAAASKIADETTQRELEAPFERISVNDAFATFGGVVDALDLAGTDETRFFEVLINSVEPALACYPRPIFLTHYPISQAALARPSLDEPKAAERYELYFRGQELCNGYTELTDPVIQRERFKTEFERRAHTSEPQYPLDERFLRALEEGLPPCSGNAMGLDRLVATLLRQDKLESVIAFTDQER